LDFTYTVLPLSKKKAPLTGAIQTTELTAQKAALILIQLVFFDSQIEILFPSDMFFDLDPA